MIRSLLTLMTIAALSGPALAQEDAVGVPGPIVYDGETFALAWTSNPMEDFYKQEYVPAGQTVEAYEQMFMVDVFFGGQTVEDAAATVIDSLKQRQETDPVVNFAMIENEETGELIVDFLLSDSSTETLIVEWNAYRYVPVDGGIAMFGISRRGYDDGAGDLLIALKDWRMDAIQALAGMDLPEVVVE